MTSQQYMDPNAFLMGGGVPGAKFEAIGAKITGIVERIEMQQQTAFGTGEPLWWDDEETRPRMQMVVTMLTQLQETPDDDGMRKLYIRGQMTKAVADAVKKAGRKGIEEGAELAVQYFADEPPPKRGFNPIKQYRAKYDPPTKQVALPDDEDDLPF